MFKLTMSQENNDLVELKYCREQVFHGMYCHKALKYMLTFLHHPY